MGRTTSSVAIAAAVAAAALLGIGTANASESSAELAAAVTTSNSAPASIGVKPVPGPAVNSAIAPVELKFAVTGPAETKVYLQKLIGGAWVRASTGYTAAGEIVTFTLPAAGKNSPATSSAQFRAVVPSPSAGYRDSISATRTVNIENPHRYTGERRTYWGFVARHCPTALLVIDKSLIAKGASGWANMRGNTIHMPPGVPPVHQRYVANHECAHLKQWQMYDTRWAAFLAAAHNVYGGGLEYGYERMADCVANAWHPVSYWGYKRGCAGRMGVVGRVFANGQSPFRIR